MTSSSEGSHGRAPAPSATWAPIHTGSAQSGWPEDGCFSVRQPLVAGCCTCAELGAHARSSTWAATAAASQPGSIWSMACAATAGSAPMHKQPGRRQQRSRKQTVRPTARQSCSRTCNTAGPSIVWRCSARPSTRPSSLLQTGSWRLTVAHGDVTHTPTPLRGSDPELDFGTRKDVMNPSVGRSQTTWASEHAGLRTQAWRDDRPP